MIGHGVLTKLADAYGVDAPTVERDYVLTHVIEAIGGATNDPRLVFKGGTALRLLHFDDYRFSADLDFSLVDDLSLNDAREIISSALFVVVERIGLPKLELGPERFIHYTGPLGREHNIKLDIADGELVSDGGSGKFDVISRYDDQVGGKVTAYTVDEVAAEKLRCVIQRVQARDLFDLYQLLGDRNADIVEIWPDFEAKTRHKGMDPEMFFERFEDRIPRWKSLWEREMDEHIPGELQPHFNAVERFVRRELRRVLP